MRTLDITETNDVSGGTFGLLSLLFSCIKPAPVYCAPAPKHAPVCAPAPKPKKKGC